MTNMTGTIDRTLSKLLDEIRKDGKKFDVVYDIGANDGRWYKKHNHLFNESKFICIEANPNNKFNIPSPHVFYNQCLSNEDDKQIEFYLPTLSSVENTGASYYREMTPHYDKNPKVLVLNTKTLNTFVKDNNLPMPDFIKFDTQGSEVDIFLGGDQVIPHAKCIICECPIMWYNKGAPTIDKYIKTLYDYGFVPSGVDHLAIRRGIVNQMDIIFVKKEIVQSIHNYQGKYTGF